MMEVESGGLYFDLRIRFIVIESNGSCWRRFVFAEETLLDFKRLIIQEL